MIKSPLILYFILSILTAYSTFSYGNDNNSNESVHYNKKDICTALKHLPIQDVIPMRDFLKTKNQTANFDNEVFLVTLNNHTTKNHSTKNHTPSADNSHNSSTIKAVFKPVPADDMGDAHAEVAAYKASIVLGFPNVPPTVIRKINDKIGSLQLYVEPSMHITDKDYPEVLQKASKEDVANLKLFYFIFGQWDSGAHNIIISNNTTSNQIQLNAIDNSGIRNKQHVKYGAPPFVRIAYSDTLTTNDWHLPFPFHNTQVIKNPTLEILHTLFGKHFSETMYKKLVTHYKNSIHYAIYQNSLWIQYHKEDPDFVLSHTHYYPEKSMAVIKKLNQKQLEDIFSEAKGCDFLAPGFFKSILERRDQVIKDYEYNKNTTHNTH